MPTVGMGQQPLFAKLCASFEDQSDKQSVRSSKEDKTRNKDLQKTKLCVYFVQGKCGLGSNCQFAHSTSEIRKAPNLTKTQLCTNFMNGNCRNKHCNYAHGEAELVKPPSFKKKLCVWFKQGKCRNGVNCGFVHDMALGGDDEPPEEESDMKPWKKSAGCAFDDASTDVPSSTSLVEFDVSKMTTKPIPDENLFRMMAGRGSAPLQRQVQAMGLAIGDLQAKLSQVQDRRNATSNETEGAALQSQVDEMQQAISQLSKQCQGMDAHLRTSPQPPPVQQVREELFGANQVQLGPMGTKAPTVSRPSQHREKVDDIPMRGMTPVKKKAPTHMGSGVVPVKYMGTQVVPAKALAKRTYNFELRVALGVVVVALMVWVEMNLQ